MNLSTDTITTILLVVLVAVVVIGLKKKSDDVTKRIKNLEKKMEAATPWSKQSIVACVIIASIVGVIVKFALDKAGPFMKRPKMSDVSPQS